METIIATTSIASITIIVCIIYLRRRSLRYSKQARQEFMKNLSADLKDNLRKEQQTKISTRKCLIDTNSDTSVATWNMTFHITGDTHIGEGVPPFGAPLGVNPGTGMTVNTMQYIIGGDHIEDVEETEEHGDLD